MEKKMIMKYYRMPGQFQHEYHGVAIPIIKKIKDKINKTIMRPFLQWKILYW